MKKTLIALAVLASSGAAMAQSTFTLYGVADANLENVKGGSGATAAAANAPKTSVTRLSSGGWNGSRWGLRGSEDLGNGLKAVFTLESGFAIDDGTSAQGGRLFGRQAFVGLEGDFGSARLGRQYSPIGNVADLVGTKNYDVLSVAKTKAASDVYRSDNAINYKSPSFAGFTAEGQYSFNFNGAEVPGAKVGRQFGLNGIYTNGPITAGVGFVQIQDVAAAVAGDQKRNEVLFVGGYDFGMAKVMAYHSQTELGAAATKAAEKMKIFGVSAAFPFGAFTVTPGFALAKDTTGVAERVNNVATAKDDAKIFTLQGIYDLSKRTAVYSNLTMVDNSAGANVGFSTASGNVPNLDQKSTGLQVGVRHRF